MNGEVVSVPKIDIRPDYWEIVQGILRKHVPEYEVWAFGSRAKWTAKEYSDLDLAIVSDHPVSLDVIAALADEFSESELPWKVDLVDWATTNESFRKIIERDRVVVLRAASLGTQLEWPVVRLGDHCIKIGSGATPKGGKESYLDAGPYSLIRSQNVYNDGFSWQGLAYISDEQAKKLDGVAVEKNDILVNITGDSVARVCNAPVEVLPARVNQHVAIVRPRPKSFDSDYLRWYLCLPEQQEKLLGLASAGATRNALTKAMLEGLLIPQPPIEIQKAMAALPVAMSQRIDLLRQTNATLESIAQALFKSWFIDFDPVRAKAEGREPEGMDAETAALFPDAFEESALGEIPKGWSATTLGETFELNPSRPLTKGANAPYLEMANAPISGHRPLQHVGARPFGSGCKFRNGDALLAKITPCLENGKSAFVDFLGEGEVGWGSTEFIVMRSRSKFPMYCAYLLIRYEPFRKFAIQSMTGTSGRQRVELSRLVQFPVVAPPDERIAVATNAIFSDVEARIAANDNQVKTLTAIRDTLLPRLISGKLRLPEAEAKLNEALA